VKTVPHIQFDAWRIPQRAVVWPAGTRAAFSLIEILLVVTLLSLIMLALMAVFNSTQTAFRASITQTDVLQGGRATMDMITSDFRQMSPSDNIYAPNLTSNLNNISSPVNFWLSRQGVTLYQSLIGVSQNQVRTNQIQSFFILSYQNQVWKGVGYFVDPYSTNYIFPLYRYDSSVIPGRPTPIQIFSAFLDNLSIPGFPASDNNTNIHHLLDGVVHLNVRAYDPNGVQLTNGYPFGQSYVIHNATFINYPSSEVSMILCSNTLPAAVEIQLGVLEDRTLSRAASFGLVAPPNSTYNYSNYLSQQSGKVHLFRQRVTIPNADPTVYQ
jgi:type II secretory pathway pseudopilin PulG